MGLDYKELLRDNLIFIKGALLATNQDALAEKINTSIDYLFYLEDTSHKERENNAELGL